MRNTKIVATVGPATENKEMIEKMILAGVNLFRFNMKYSPKEWHNSRINLIRKTAKRLKVVVGIMIDIPRNDFKIEIEDFDWVALSYLRGVWDIEKLKQHLKRHKIEAKIIAKIENGEAMKNLEEIAVVSDGLMVARGDLGRETPIEDLALFQKKIIDVGRKVSKPVIVATEMLYSMVNSDKPTRAEATDVANAVFDGTDALMLSEETAIGKHPIEAIRVMDKIAKFSETAGELRQTDLKAVNLAEALTESAARMVGDKLDKPIKAVLAFTRTGTTARMMSRYHLQVPIVAIGNDQGVMNRLGLSYGVQPICKKFETEKYIAEDPVFTEIKNEGTLKTGDTVIIVHGDTWYGTGPANRLSVRTI